MRYPFQQFEYLTSAHKLSQLPEDVGLEVAFAGRSNAGKSTAINTITGRNKLARTSKTPGRTQQMVVFELDELRRLVDLPGYGYAKVPEKLRSHWGRELQAFFDRRAALQGLFLVMDIRHPLKEQDMQMIHWTHHRGLPCHILLTKADKLKRGAALKMLREVRDRLKGMTVSVQMFSALKREGLDEARGLLADWLQLDINEKAER